MEVWIVEEQTGVYSGKAFSVWGAYSSLERAKAAVMEQLAKALASYPNKVLRYAGASTFLPRTLERPDWEDSDGCSQLDLDEEDQSIVISRHILDAPVDRGAD